jgi:hypothetical protein
MRCFCASQQAGSLCLKRVQNSQFSVEMQQVTAVLPGGAKSRVEVKRAEHELRKLGAGIDDERPVEHPGPDGVEAGRLFLLAPPLTPASALVYKRFCPIII